MVYKCDRRKHKGGNKSIGRPTTAPTPFLQHGFTDGAGSQRQQAAANTNAMNNKQQSMFARGGSGPSKGSTVPQFSSGTGAGPVNANTSSVNNNATAGQTVSDGSGDCFATPGGCGAKVGGSSSAVQEPEGFQNWRDVFPVAGEAFPLGDISSGGKRLRKTKGRKAKARKTKGRKTKGRKTKGRKTKGRKTKKSVMRGKKNSRSKTNKRRKVGRKTH